MDSLKTSLVENRQVINDKTRIDQLTHCFFQVFSNKDNRKVDLSILKQLFIQEGIIIKNCGQPEIYNLQQFIEPREKMLNEGVLIDFCEEELTETTEIFGNIAHRFSLYRKSGILAGEAFKTKGMKTIQFIRIDDAWKITALAWDDERDNLRVPCENYHQD